MWTLAPARKTAKPTPWDKAAHKIKLTKNDGSDPMEVEGVATTDDGLSFAGDDGTVVTKKLNGQLDIKGGKSTGLTDGNIGVVADNGALAVKLAKDIDLTSSGSVKVGDTQLSSSGLTISNADEAKVVKFTNAGISAGGQQITNVASGGETLTNAANIGDVKKAAASSRTEVIKGANVESVTETADATDGHTIYTVNVDNLAVKAKRYEVKNAVDPTQGSITEEKESELEEFIDYAKVIIGTLGHRLFEPISTQPAKAPDSSVADSDSTIKLHLERTIKAVGKVEADGVQTSEGFVVLKGSKISSTDDDTIPSVIKERRNKALLDENGLLKEDMLFTSPSYAAMFVIGKSANGLTSWKTEDGRTLKSLESSESEES